MSELKLFSPDTLHDDLHHAFAWAVKRGSYNNTSKATIKKLRKEHPKVYCELASMAHEGKWKHGNSYMFRCGINIFFDMLRNNKIKD